MLAQASKPGEQSMAIICGVCGLVCGDRGCPLEAERDTYDLAVKTAARRIAELETERSELIESIRDLRSEAYEQGKYAGEAAVVERLAVAMMAFPNSSPHEKARMAAFIRAAGEQKEQKNG
jgi:hypothetical protein